MKKTIAALAIAITIVALAACGSSGKDAQIETGRRIYNTGGASSVPCATCHTLDGSDLVGPSFKGIKDRAATRIPGMSAEDYIRQSIVDPEAYVVDGYAKQMYRDYGKVLTKDEIDGVIAFLMTQ